MTTISAKTFTSVSGNSIRKTNKNKFDHGNSSKDLYLIDVIEFLKS